MKSPLVVTICSLIPGLGFLVLGQYKRALSFGLIVNGLWIISSIVSSDILAETFLSTAVMFWVVQIAIAAQSARTLREQESGEIIAAKYTAKNRRKPPQGLTRQEKALYVPREIIRPELETGKRIIKCLLGKTKTPLISINPAKVFSAPYYSIGMTQRQLIVVELDSLMKASQVIRIPFSEVTRAEVYGRKGKLFDLDWGIDQHITVEVLIYYRAEARAIADTLG